MTLHITPVAGNAIAELAKSEGVERDGGLRLASLASDNGVPGGFDASVAALPIPEDVTVTEETSGAKVFLDPLTADQLVNATLDLAGTGENDLTFQLIPDRDAPPDGDASRAW